MPDSPVPTTETLRLPQGNVPQTKAARDRLLQAARDYVAQVRPVPPLSLDELRSHTRIVLERACLASKYADFVAVVLNNEVWRDTVAVIPYSRRLFLLPNCLRNPAECPAPFDDLGLVCRHCGRCPIDPLTRQAEQLGYAVLVAEGSPVVMSLIEAGKVEAVVGVSCLSVLERVFPYMEAGAVPGVAVPLLRDGCQNTQVDLDWVWEALYQTGEDHTRRLDLDGLHRQVTSWFGREVLAGEILLEQTRTEQIALDWMALAGKRWRPFLTACTCRALQGETGGVADDVLRKTALAVECFHKASLIHDDIEDDDGQRYGRQTLAAEHGVAVALNVGDLLVGEGYRLLAELDLAADVRSRLLKAAALGHRTLCLGQGQELCWGRARRPAAVEEVLQIFRQKTAPAFEVALSLGAILAGEDLQVSPIFKDYSEALGIAYQIRDDIEDLSGPQRGDLMAGRRLSILVALAWERADEEGRRRLASLWSAEAEPDPRSVESLIACPQVEAMALRAVETYKARAIGSLIGLRNAGLKGLLRRVVAKVFNDFERMGCCDDPQT
jgi:geranylgeranyl pyrophosphate synthase